MPTYLFLEGIPSEKAPLHYMLKDVKPVGDPGMRSIKLRCPALFGASTLIIFVVGFIEPRSTVFEPLLWVARRIDSKVEHQAAGRLPLAESRKQIAQRRRNEDSIRFVHCLAHSPPSVF